MMPEPSALEVIVGSPRYERFMSGQQSVIDLRNIAAVAAQTQGWGRAFSELASGKVEYVTSDGNARVIDFAKKIKSARQIDDPTNFRRYFTVLSVVDFLTDKFSADFHSGQPFNGVTAQTVMHYANISVSDSYNCLVWLARDGFLTRKKVHELPEWIVFSEKIQKEKESAGKLAKLSTEEQKEIAQLKKESEQALKKLNEALAKELNFLAESDKSVEPLLDLHSLDERSDSTNRALAANRYYERLEETLSKKLRAQLAEISNTYAERKAALKAEITPEERELWNFSKSLPQYAYIISEQGRQFLKKAQDKYPAGVQGFGTILQEVDRRISALGLLHKPTLQLSLAHILEDKLEDISFGVHRELLNEWGQLPEDRVLLFYLRSAPFVFNLAGGRTETKNLSYIGPAIEGSASLAKIYVDKDGRVISHNGAVSVLGLFAMSEQEDEKLRGTAKSAAAELEAGLPPKYGLELREDIRYGKIALATTDAETANCNKFGIAYAGARITAFDVQGVESVKLIGEDTRVSVPEQLASAYTLVFLPKFFDPKGIKFRPRLK
ncbi:MAG: hypothetical protein HYT16_00380 [DPANN group archaeon]|nr:hypothetical protein [DPANN group archaeon]